MQIQGETLYTYKSLYKNIIFPLKKQIMRKTNRVLPSQSPFCSEQYCLALCRLPHAALLVPSLEDASEVLFQTTFSTQRNPTLQKQGTEAEPPGPANSFPTLLALPLSHVLESIHSHIFCHSSPGTICWGLGQDCEVTRFTLPSTSQVGMARETASLTGVCLVV